MNTMKPATQTHTSTQIYTYSHTLCKETQFLKMKLLSMKKPPQKKGWQSMWHFLVSRSVSIGTVFILCSLCACAHKYMCTYTHTHAQTHTHTHTHTQTHIFQNTTNRQCRSLQRSQDDSHFDTSQSLGHNHHWHSFCNDVDSLSHRIQGHTLHSQQHENTNILFVLFNYKCSVFDKTVQDSLMFCMSNKYFTFLQ